MGVCKALIPKESLPLIGFNIIHDSGGPLSVLLFITLAFLQGNSVHISKNFPFNPRKNFNSFHFFIIIRMCFHELTKRRFKLIKGLYFINMLTIYHIKRFEHNVLTCPVFYLTKGIVSLSFKLA